MEITPSINTDALQEKANEYALKGAIEVIKEFYTGYNSPYKKSIEEDLKRKDLTFAINLPDIIATINAHLGAEVDKIANEAIAFSYVPMVREFLVREDKQILFSSVLKKLIEESYGIGYDDFSCDVHEDHQYHWLDVSISNGKKEYGLTLHQTSESKKEGPKRYQLLSMPSEKFSSPAGHIRSLTMKLSIDGVELEMPFAKDILRDRFTMYIAKLVMANSEITIDYDDFQESWFQGGCHCH